MWLICVELLPLRHFAYSVSINWLFNVIVLLLVKLHANYLTPQEVGGYALCGLIGFFVLAAWLP